MTSEKQLSVASYQLSALKSGLQHREPDDRPLNFEVYQKQGFRTVPYEAS